MGSLPALFSEGSVMEREGPTKPTATLKVERKTGIAPPLMGQGTQERGTPLCPRGCEASATCGRNLPVFQLQPAVKGRVITPRPTVAGERREQGMLYWALVFLV